MPLEFQDGLKEIRREFELFNTEPRAPVKFVWDLFWEIRAAKAFENPISHIDIKTAADLYKTELKQWEIKAILFWDRLYYHSRKD